MGCPRGYKFNPTEQELVSYFLKNKILGLPFSDDLIDVKMYGDNATPWELFDPQNQSIPWLPSLDPSNQLKPSEGILYVLTKLSNVGKTSKSGNKQKNRVAGCGTWHLNNTGESVIVYDENGNPRSIGYKRNFTFRSSSQETEGQWTMTEYNIDAEAHGIDPSEFNCEDIVVCKIKRDDTKSSLGGKLVSRKRKFVPTPRNMV